MLEPLYKARHNVVDCDIGGDRALLHLEHNTYFTVNRTAAELWLALGVAKTIPELVDVITSKFDVEDDLCQRDIKELLAQMTSAEIVEIVTERESD